MADIEFGELVCDVNWRVFSLVTRAIQIMYEYRQCLHLIWRMKTNLPNCQIKINVKCTTYMVCEINLLVMKYLVCAVRSLPMLMSPVESPPPHSDIKSIEKNFRNTVNNIKRHLNQCDVQELVTNFNMVVDKEKFPYFKDRVKRKLYKCKTIGDLLVRISPFVSWKKREVLRALVEASDCQEAVDELNRFEAQLDYGQPTTSFPIPPPSSEICPDPESDAIIVSAKSNQDLRKTSLKDIDHVTGVVVQAGGMNEKDVDLQATNHGSSILYWLLPKNKVKSFEANIRDNLDFLYAEGILEISLDPNIVITTGRKLRVRSLSYLTKLPPQDPRPLQTARPPQRAEVSKVPICSYVAS